MTQQQKAPHPRAKKFGEHCTASTWPFDASSVCAKQHIAHHDILVNVPRQDWQYLWNNYKRIATQF